MRRAAFAQPSHLFETPAEKHCNRIRDPFIRADKPGDVAAGVVGGAIGTAGAIATAPFRDDSHAYYNNGYGGGYDQSYAARNGFVCQPGTWFKGEDGRRHICQ